MPNITELPDAILEKVAEKARAEIVARGLRCAPSPCGGRNTAEQLDHAQAISKILNRLAKQYGWSDDFCLMIDVAQSTVDRLFFFITHAVSVKTGVDRQFFLNSGDAFAVDGQGNGSVNPTPRAVMHINNVGTFEARNVRIVARDVVAKSRAYLKGTFDPKQDVRHRHPFAQESDLGAILKWESSQPRPDPLGAAPEAKPALLNAMVVRGGHDSAGWQL